MKDLSGCSVGHICCAPVSSGSSSVFAFSSLPLSEPLLFLEAPQVVCLTACWKSVLLSDGLQAVAVVICKEFSFLEILWAGWVMTESEWLSGSLSAGSGGKGAQIPVCLGRN